MNGKAGGLHAQRRHQRVAGRRESDAQLSRLASALAAAVHQAAALQHRLQLALELHVLTSSRLDAPGLIALLHTLSLLKVRRCSCVALPPLWLVLLCSCQGLPATSAAPGGPAHSCMHGPA